MPGAHLLTAAPLLPLAVPLAERRFPEDWGHEINAVGAILLAFVLAQVVDRLFAHRGEAVTTAMTGGEYSPVMDTRVRLVRRLVYAAIVLFGFALALNQYDGARRIATGVLASSAVLGLVVGFAAQRTLANAIAGVLIAISQPIRIGDLVTFEDETGIVEDIQLTYTHLHTTDGRRVIVPNDRLAQSTIQNHTIIDPRVYVEVSLWLAPDGDAVRALEVLSADRELERVEIAEVERDGVRLVVGAWAESAADRGALAARIRARSLERLRNERLSSVGAPGG